MRIGAAFCGAAAAALAAALAPARADAAACCGSGHGVGPLLTDAERAAATFGIGGTFELGSWNSRGKFHALPAGDYRRDIRFELGWIVRFLRDGQLGVTVPAVVSFERFGGVSNAGAGPGDVSVFARYDLVRSSALRWYPKVALTFSTLLPTGQPTGADGRPATGLGAGELRPGIALEKRWIQGFFATVTGSVGFRTHYHLASGTEVALSPRVQLFAAAGPFWDFGLSTSVGVLFEREAGPAIDGQRAPATARGRTSAVVFAAYDLTARWTVVGSAQVGLPVNGAGENEPLNVAPIVAIRRVWGALD